jgi:hypothetical protein
MITKIDHRFTGWRDDYGRKAQLLNPFDVFGED